MPTFTDIFCGAGGSSIGLTGAGYELQLAANHWDRAIETHSANFRDAEHLCADVNNYDMRRLPTTDVLWASPICTEASPAGKKTRRRTRQISGQGTIEEFGHVPSAGMERTRATFHDVIRATEVHRYAAVMVENVPEVVGEWELFDWWVEGMKLLGYNVQFVSVSSAHVGGEDNPHAPQWRDRLYMVFTRHGIPLPDVAPRPLALCVTCGVDVRGKQSWTNLAGRKVGRYRRQYVYRCPNSACRHAVVEPYILPAASAIDWSNLGTRIGDRAKPLADNTLRRIEAGLRMFAQPVMVNSNHDDDRLYPAAGSPLPSRTTKIGDGVACPPMLIPSGGTWAEAPMSALHEAMRTRTANPKGFEALLTPEPFITVPPGTFYMKNYGGHADPRRMSKSVSEPFGTITASSAGGHHALVVPYYRTGKAKNAADPFDTVTTNDRFALVTGEAIQVDDCRYRMIQPRESLRAQRFPDSYIVTGNRGEQTMQAGNAVSANVAQWLGEQVAIALGERAA